MAISGAKGIRFPAPATAPDAGPHVFAPMLDALPAAAYTCDACGQISYFNQRAVGLWGRHPRLNDREERYCGSLRLFTPDGSPVDHAECWMALAIRDRQEYNHREVRLERPDGTHRVALAYAKPVFDGDGALLGAVNILVDVTGQRRRETAWRRMHSALAHRDRLSLVGEMAARLTHELNQPLTAILNSTEACLQSIRTGGADPEMQVQDLERVVHQAERATAIVRRYRGFTRHGQPRRQAVELNTLIGETLRFLDDEFPDRSFSPRFTAASGLPPVLADPVQLQQVLLNLLRNGIEALEGSLPPGEGLWITADADAPNRRIHVSVRDAGTGLDEAVRPCLFQPFVTTKAHGVGLGLAISKGIVEAHGGSLWAEENDGPGTTFHLTLPVAE